MEDKGSISPLVWVQERDTELTEEKRGILELPNADQMLVLEGEITK